MNRKNNISVGVIDIGSNSIRLVIYDTIHRAPVPMFNEKALCGLANGLDKTGKLNREGLKLAYDSIGRFIKLSEVMKVDKLFVFATSAVRDAEDGRDFVNNLEKLFNITVEVLSGEEEAKYSGMGVAFSIQNASGIAADLGGGSLELIGLKDSSIMKDAISYPLGPLRFSGNISTIKEYNKVVERSLSSFNFLPYYGRSIYLIGGAFRSLAKLDMEYKDYPLRVIHNYTVETKDILPILKKVNKISNYELLQIPDLSPKRAKFVPFAAIITEQIIKFSKPSNIVFSAFGVREGLILSKLTAKEKSYDGLIEGASDLIRVIGRSPEYGFELNQWLNPLFENIPENKKRLILAACILSDISCYENTEYRGEMAYRKIMDSSLIDVTHKERAFIAQAIYFRYNGIEKNNALSDPIVFLLDKKDIKLAKIVGTAIRLARSLSGSHIGVLNNLPLNIDGQKIIISFPVKYSQLYGEKIAKRLSQLAKITGFKIAVKK